MGTIIAYDIIDTVLTRALTRIEHREIGFDTHLSVNKQQQRLIRDVDGRCERARKQ